MRTLRPLLIAIQFLTRLPVELKGAPTSEELGRSVPWYPAVGLLLGAMLAGLQYLLPENTGLVPAAVLLCSWVLLTGALHLDGLADSADAWVGGLGDKERTLAIMKDPRSGPVGVVAVASVLLLKFAALDLAVSRHDEIVLMIATTVARTAPLLLFITTPYIRPGGIGASMVQCLPRHSTALTLAAVIIGLLLTSGMRGAWALLSATVLFLLVQSMMVRRIGGATGDTTGALIELTESAVLVATLLA